MVLTRFMQKYLSLIKFSHTIFAMPFAMVGLVLGTKDQDHDFSFILLLKVVLCMVFARSAAMAFNRYLDRDIDRKNPRTVGREIPSGQLSERRVLWFTLLNAVLFIMVTYTINDLCFYLSPVALMVILGYSFTKRFTALCHLVLGAGLALAPIGAYVAVTGKFHFLPVLLGSVVLFWVSGFDIIYALQDEEFDKNNQLNSIPARLGVSSALLMSRLLHVVASICLLIFVYFMDQQHHDISFLLWTGAGVFIVMLFYQQTLVSATDLSRVGLAFFTFNGMASIVFALFFMADVFWI